MLYKQLGKLNYSLKSDFITFGQLLALEPNQHGYRRPTVDAKILGLWTKAFNMQHDLKMKHLHIYNDINNMFF